MTPSEVSTGKRSEAVRVWMLGGFRVSVGSRTIEEGAWRLRKAAALVKLLALAPGHRLHREQVMDILWPDSGRRAASNSLRKALYVARATLDQVDRSRYLVSEDESLVLCPKSDLWVDVDAFEEAASTAFRSKDPAAHRTALELYAGDLLPENRYEEWAEARRVELRGMWLSLQVGLAQVYEGDGEYERGIEALRKVAAEEPTHQEAHTGLMRIYGLSGRQGEALAQYERLETTLSNELGTEPNAAIRAMKEEISAGRFPSPERSGGQSTDESIDSPRHNLPAARTSFVGRERDMIEVKRALAMTRLLTLTGVGGSGKTRLALEVARDLLGAYPDGVWLVELAPFSEEGLVPQAVASALGVEERPGQPLTRTLAEASRSKETLLIFDNCEHLVEGAARLVDSLLNSCPRLRVLATSREALDVAGEVRWPVPFLPVPTSEFPLKVEGLEGYASARLFVERASNRCPGFAITTESVRAIAQICRRLDGIPLAIELAAARIGTLSVKQINEMLEDSLGFLTGGGRTAVPRQRSLRGTLDWSHGLLNGPERKAFWRLSVFAGGLTLEAAEAVVPGDDIGEAKVLNLLSELVEKSLVVAETPAEGEVRYRMLEPVRQYGQEKLEGSGETQVTKDSHARHFLFLAEKAEPELLGPREAEWFERLETEHDNMRAALSWSLEASRFELGLRLAGALRLFWLEGHYSEGQGWLEEVLDKDAGAASAIAQVKALKAASVIARRQGNYARARAAAEKALAVCAELGVADRHDVAFLTNMLGNVALHMGNLERASKLAKEGLALGRQANDAECITDSLLLLGVVSRRRGHYEQAKGFFEEVVALSRKLGGSALLLGVSLNDLGWTSLHEGDLEQATVLFEEAATLTREKRGEEMFMAPFSLGWAALLGGDLERARALQEECLALCCELGAKGFISYCLETLACVAVAESESKRAARLFGAAQVLRDALDITLAPDFRALVEPYFVGARSQLQAAIWKAAYAEGRWIGSEEAVKYALAEVETATSSVPPTPNRRSADLSSSLTRREQEIAALVARGMTNRQIATELMISEHTAATHIGRILKKLGLQSRSQIGSWLTQQRP